MGLVPEAKGVLERLETDDGVAFSDWREPAREARRGGLIIASAVWGITPHLRSLAVDFAEAGWEVLIPGLFDRFDAAPPERDVSPERLAERMAWAEALGWGEACLPTIAAAVSALRPPVSILGFCFGGTVAWLAACRLQGLAAAVSFYGGHVADFRNETPLCPVMLHFGRDDPLIPMAEVEAIADAQPELPLHVYPAGHAFVAPSDLHADSASLSLLRTRAFLHRAAGAKGEM